MSIPFSGTLTRSAGIYSAIGKQLKSVSLKPVKQVVFRFDPFHQNVKTIRHCMSLFSAEKIGNTNLNCTYKVDIVDNIEPTIILKLDSKEVIFKTANLDTLNFLKEFNRVVGPLIPKEEEVSGKVAGKLAGKSKVGAGKQGKPQKRK